MGFVPVGARFSTSPLRSVEPVGSVAPLIRSAPPLRFSNVGAAFSTTSLCSVEPLVSAASLCFSSAYLWFAKCALVISCVPLLQLWLRRISAMDHRMAPRVQHPVPAPAWPAGLSRKQVKLLSARVTDWSRAASCVLTGLTRAAPDEVKFARATYLKDLTSTECACTCNDLLQHAVVSAVLTQPSQKGYFTLLMGS